MLAGKPFSDNRDIRGIVCCLTGDWKYFKLALDLEQWWGSEEICWQCRMNRRSFTLLDGSHPHFLARRSQAEFLQRFAMVKELVHLSQVIPDYMHMGPLGQQAPVCGAVLQ